MATESDFGSDIFSESPREHKRSHLTIKERVMIKNVYEGLLKLKLAVNVTHAVEVCSELTKVSVATVYRSIKKSDQTVPPPKKQETRGRKKIFVDEDTKYAIRRIVHGFFFQNELPTMKKIVAAVNSDDQLPKLSPKIIYRTLHDLNFRYLKRSRNSTLIEKDEIVLWRRRYLRQMMQFRNEGRKIYFTDETWLNEGHTVSKIWHDLNIKSKREAFLDGLSTGLKAPSGKGRRLIITHIGSDTGFLEEGMLSFESKKTGDYHKDMNSDVYEKWFESILSKLEPRSVVVMDNAPYHSRHMERLPTSRWNKKDLRNWLTSKNIPFDTTSLKAELLSIARMHKPRYTKYAIDEMAAERGITVLRLPPYHCELNPIELIWAQVKGSVARNNKTFKLQDVKVLLQDAIQDVTADSWRKCIQHVQKTEKQMWDLDTCVDVMVEPLIIEVECSDNSDDDDYDGVLSD